LPLERRDAPDPGAPAVPARPARRWNPRNVALGVVGLAAFGGLLEVVPRIGLVPARYMPPSSQILAELVDQVQHAEFWVALRETLITWGIGLGIAVAGGVVLGVVIGAVPLLRAATASTIEFLRPIPSVAWIPLAVILYGSSRQATLLLVVYASFWQVLVQVLHGVVDVDPVARDTARAYRLGRWAQVRYLVWPTALPYAVTGIRLATSVALILTVTGELLLGTPGLGQQINTARLSGTSAIESMYALVVVTGLLGVGANLVTRAAERRVLAWHTSVRTEVAA
jgi:ABC-type nitrate/sulfonate/bicarbonate transport system permease component